MSSENFYEDMDFRYPEYAIALEDVKPGTKGKFYIPVLTPTLSGGKASDKKVTKNKAKIVNKKDKLSTAAYKSCNYVELWYPSYYKVDTVIKSKCKHDCGTHSHECALNNTHQYNCNDIIKKGDKVIVVFVGGDTCEENIRIIARC